MNQYNYSQQQSQLFIPTITAATAAPVNAIDPNQLHYQYKYQYNSPFNSNTNTTVNTTTDQVLLSHKRCHPESELDSIITNDNSIGFKRQCYNQQQHQDQPNIINTNFVMLADSNISTADRIKQQQSIRRMLLNSNNNKNNQ